MLLDEPTNHLDEASKKWLSAWIKSSPSTTIIVSHEKELLDGACSHMAEVRGKGLHWYVGNYTAFLEARDERIRVAKALYEKQCVEAAELEDFVRRFSANASKASQAGLFGCGNPVYLINAPSRPINYFHSTRALFMNDAIKSAGDDDDDDDECMTTTE